MRIKEFKITDPVELAIQEHINKGVPFSECMFRAGSTAFTEFYNRVREMRESLNLDWQDQELLSTDIGECITVEGEVVPLDVPMEDMDPEGPEVKIGSILQHIFICVAVQLKLLKNMLTSQAWKNLCVF